MKYIVRDGWTLVRVTHGTALGVAMMELLPSRGDVSWWPVWWGVFFLRRSGARTAVAALRAHHPTWRYTPRRVRLSMVAR